MLDTAGQILHLKKKGVQFELGKEEDAYEYLNSNNNYFKLRAYRKNFPKHPDGVNKDKYIHLDFEMLKDLAIIDMRLRYVLVHLALDIEHYTKVGLLKTIETKNEGGYKIVREYFDFLKGEDSKNGTKNFDKLNNELEKNKSSAYCGGIFDKYNGNYPVWAFLEIISFGTLVHFYKFCAEQYSDKDMKDTTFLLLCVKEVRNAAAHSNCIINDLGAKDKKHNTNYNVLRALESIPKSTRDIRFESERMRQIITTLYTHTTVVTSSGVRNRAKKDLEKLIERMKEHMDYYEKNDNITQSFNFFEKCVDILF